MWSISVSLLPLALFTCDLATITMSTHKHWGNPVLKDSLIRRLILFRSTASGVVFLPITMPILLLDLSLTIARTRNSSHWRRYWRFWNTASNSSGLWRRWLDGYLLSTIGSRINIPYADNTLRPLARRRLITNRPFLVAIRARKPWFRLRLITLGWNVLFM